MTIFYISADEVAKALNVIKLCAALVAAYIYDREHITLKELFFGIYSTNNLLS